MVLVSGNSATRTKVLSTGCKTCWKYTTVFRLFMILTSHFPHPVPVPVLGEQGCVCPLSRDELLGSAA